MNASRLIKEIQSTEIISDADELGTHKEKPKSKWKKSRKKKRKEVEQECQEDSEKNSESDEVEYEGRRGMRKEKEEK